MCDPRTVSRGNIERNRRDSATLGYGTMVSSGIGKAMRKTRETCGVAGASPLWFVFRLNQGGAVY